jgi:hypothetical protein
LPRATSLELLILFGIGDRSKESRYLQRKRRCYVACIDSDI